MSNHSTEPLTWKRGSPGKVLDENEATLATVGKLIKKGRKDEVVTALQDWSALDVVELLVQLPFKRARKLFNWLPTFAATQVLVELRPEYRSAMMEQATLNRLVELLDSLEPEEAADALAELPMDTAQSVLPRLAAGDEVRELCAYSKDSAGGIMTKRFVAVPQDWSVDQVIEQVRQNASRIKKLHAVYVVDAQRRLLGTVKLNRLLLLDPKKPIGQAIEACTDNIAVRPDMDQEDVALLAKRKRLVGVPVVDADNRVIGRITPEQLREVARQEAEEDMRIMGGVAGEPRSTESVWRIVRSRLPWLLVGMIGASLAATVVGSFEDELAQATILASFIPIVMSMAGNAGIQASTVAVQQLATGEVWIGDIGWRLGKELLGALTNGLIAASILALLVVAIAQFIDIENPVRLAITAGLSLTGVILLAVAMGAVVPLLLDHFGIDPAMATGVFITTGNDIIAVLVFFFMVTTFYFT